jgi:hypothetical protein
MTMPDYGDFLGMGTGSLTGRTDQGSSTATSTLPTALPTFQQNPSTAFSTAFQSAAQMTTSGGGGGGGSSGSGLDLVPGALLAFESANLDRQFAGQQNDLDRALSRELAAMQADAAREIARINNDFTAKQNKLNRAFEEEMRGLDRALQRELEANRITSAEYMQGRDLAQRESEFARSIALQTLVADRDYEIQTAQLELNRVAEVRAERLLQAQLAANPADFVAYEFYKRGLGAPQDMALAEQMGAQGEGGPQNLLGEDYPDAPPAYSDETLQQVLSSVQGGQNALYNPALGGTGAFGAQINSPNELSRKQGMSLSNDEMGILSSFLRAGVETSPGGARVAISPDEYFRQAENSWVPTMSGAGGQRTNYT